MKTLILKVGKHRGNPRVWIEGKQLLAYGFSVGERFSVHYEPSKVSLLLDAEGDRVVSGRARKGEALPIVEINSGSLSDSLGRSQHITATLLPGAIVLTKGSQ